MSTPQRHILAVPAQKLRKAARSVPKMHAVPTTRGEKHLGATEDQVSPTMPPKADDDEPKQG